MHGVSFHQKTPMRGKAILKGVLKFTMQVAQKWREYIKTPAQTMCTCEEKLLMLIGSKRVCYRLGEWVARINMDHFQHGLKGEAPVQLRESWRIGYLE